MLSYLSVCSGIEAATEAWHPLGWRPFAFSQFDPENDYSRGPDFPSAVLAHHYGSNLPGDAWSGNAPPNFGDMTKFEEWPDATIDALVGGTPCQDFSIAGLGKGLDGERGNLMLTYAAIARRYRPAWLAWENVPGVLSNDRGRAFASLLGLLCGRRVVVPAGGWQSAGIVEGVARGYGLAWRVLDAQYVRVDGFSRAVPQRRRRVFVVGYCGDWRRAAAVLFERASLYGHPAPSRQSGQSIGCADGAGALCSDFDAGLIPAVANPLTARMSKGVNTTMDEGQTMIVVVPGMRVRCLMPLECERLQGFRDGYTDILFRGKRAADAPRYKALGNSMAVNVMRWLGRRIEMVNAL